MLINNLKGGSRRILAQALLREHICPVVLSVGVCNGECERNIPTYIHTNAKTKK